MKLVKKSSLNVNYMPGTDLNASHMLPHLISTLTHFLEETQLSVRHWGASPAHRLCFVWPQQAESDDEYEEDDEEDGEDDDNYNVLRDFSRHRSKHSVLFHLSPPPSYKVGVIITLLQIRKLGYTRLKLLAAQGRKKTHTTHKTQEVVEL